jgi:excisionase family DNA binding protein
MLAISVARGAVSGVTYIVNSNKLNRPQVNPQALKVRQAADYLGLATISIRRLIKRGLIRPNRALRHILIPISELDRFINTGGAA